MEHRKQLICDALRAWIAQRPGLEFGNYGSAACYRAEMRGIAKDLRHARTLLQYVEARDSITADMILAGTRAYSGRLSIKMPCDHDEYSTCGNCGRTWCDKCDPAPSALCHYCHGRGFAHAKPGVASIEYCTGQYWPTEYRRAVCAVLASAIWDYWRDHAMPPIHHTADKRYNGIDRPVSCDYYPRPHGRKGHCSAGDWLRENAVCEFGRGIAARWFQ